MEVKIAPSILSADFSCLGHAVRAMGEWGADMVHIDVMDGHFVPPITIGPIVVKALKPLTDRPFDVHLMVTNPMDHVDAFIDAGADSGIMVFVFTASADSRELIDCDEGTLEWVDKSSIVDLDLVDDLPEILPRVLAMPDDAPPYFAHVSYDASDTIRIRYG